jgi:hypothetical protein
MADEPQPEAVHHVHDHYEYVEFERYRREPPVNRDPLATYDALWRKQPKRLGFLDFCRAIPGYVGQFPGRVPEDRITLDQDGQQAIFECVCGEVIHAPVNTIEACQGACGRSFAFTGQSICVAYLEPEPEAEKEPEEQPV